MENARIWNADGMHLNIGVAIEQTIVYLHGHVTNSIVAEYSP